MLCGLCGIDKRGDPLGGIKMKKKLKVNVQGFYDKTQFTNENYTMQFERNKIIIYERKSNFYFLEIDTAHIETFHVKKMLLQFGFELVEGYVVLNNEIDFLEFFKGKNVGIIKTVQGKNLYVGILGMEDYSKEYLEDTFKVLINF